MIARPVRVAKEQNSSLMRKATFHRPTNFHFQLLIFFFHYLTDTNFFTFYIHSFKHSHSWPLFRVGEKPMALSKTLPKLVSLMSIAIMRYHLAISISFSFIHSFLYPMSLNFLIDRFLFMLSGVGSCRSQSNQPHRVSSQRETPSQCVTRNNCSFYYFVAFILFFVYLFILNW